MDHDYTDTAEAAYLESRQWPAADPDDEDEPEPGDDFDEHPDPWWRSYLTVTP